MQNWLNEMRNQLIINDVVESYKSGRNCVVLTTAHAELLAKELNKIISDVRVLWVEWVQRKQGKPLNRLLIPLG